MIIKFRASINKNQLDEIYEKLDKVGKETKNFYEIVEEK